MKKTIELKGAYNKGQLGGDGRRARVKDAGEEPDANGQIAAVGAALLGHSNPYEKWDVRGEIKRKLQGYAAQDRARRGGDASDSIDVDATLTKLLSCKLKCYYCENPMKVLYSKARDSMQWTLDRLDNDAMHTPENTVMACMKCNLQRRRRRADAFRDTKQMKIVRKGLAEQDD